MLPSRQREMLFFFLLALEPNWRLAGRVRSLRFVFWRLGGTTGIGEDFIVILLLLGQVQWMILSLLVVTNLPLLSLHPRSSSSTFSPVLFANAAFITSRRRSKLSAPCGVPLRPASISVATFCMRWRSLLFSFLDCVAPCTPQRGNLGPRCLAWRFFLSDLANRRLASVGAALNPPLLQVCPPSIMRLRDSMGLQRANDFPVPSALLFQTSNFASS